MFNLNLEKEGDVFDTIPAERKEYLIDSFKDIFEKDFNEDIKNNVFDKKKILKFAVALSKNETEAMFLLLGTTSNYVRKTTIVNNAIPSNIFNYNANSPEDYFKIESKKKKKAILKSVNNVEEEAIDNENYKNNSDIFNRLLEEDSITSINELFYAFYEILTNSYARLEVMHEITKKKAAFYEKMYEEAKEELNKLQ